MANEKRLSDLTAAQIGDAYRAIGRYITSVSDVDLALSSLLAAVTNLHGPMDELIVHSIDFNRKREIIRAFDRLAGKDRPFNQITKLVDLSATLMATRHIVAHGTIASDGKELAITTLTLPQMSKHMRRKVEYLKVSKLDGLSERADSASAEMIEIADKIRASTAATPAAEA